MITNLEQLWKDALVDIELNTSKANFATWFQNTIPSHEKNGILFLGVPNTFVKEWLSTKYHQPILKAIHNLTPVIKNIEYIICSPTQINNKPQQVVIQETQPEKEEQLEFKELYIDKEANLNPKYKFDSFIVGSFNEVAYAASLAVTKNIGTVYNPLFIYGGVGLGKTHLLQSVGNKIKQENPQIKVRYITSEKFANDYVSSIQSGSIQSFKDKYRQYNVLIIDDIQFFSNKLKIQEEFFHIFNSLYENNQQIIFSSDKSPKHIIGLEERLRSRFEGGMMIDITKPDFETRLAILKDKVEKSGYIIDYKIIEYVASAIQENIRELVGALNTIIAQYKLRNRTLSLSEIQEILKKNIKPTKNININSVIEVIADFYGIEKKILFEKTRRKEIVKPRQIAMYILREDLNTSYPCIGNKFGQKDHTTVIYAYKKIKELREKDSKINQEIEQIKSTLYEQDA